MYNQKVLNEIKNSINNESDNWEISDSIFSEEFEFIDPNLYNLFMEETNAENIYDQLITYNKIKINKKNKYNELEISIKEDYNLNISTERKEEITLILNKIINKEIPIPDNLLLNILIELNLFEENQNNKKITYISRNNNIYEFIKYKELNAHNESQKFKKVYNNVSEKIINNYFEYLKEIITGVENNKKLNPTPEYKHII